MNKFINSNIGRLRILAFLEGISLLLLVFVAVPIKYGLQMPVFVQWIGQIHGIFFILFVFNAIQVSVEEKWQFSKITWKVLLSCFIPFGTFYMDRTVFAKIHEAQMNRM